MRTKITYNGEVISFTEGNKIKIDCAGDKMQSDILIETADSPIPSEVSTEEEMTEILTNATSEDVGAVYKYMGETTDTYENGALYVVEASLISFTIGDATYQAESGMTWEDWVADTNYNTNGYVSILLSGVTVAARMTDTVNGYGVAYNDAFVPITEAIVSGRAYTEKAGQHSGGAD